MSILRKSAILFLLISLCSLNAPLVQAREFDTIEGDDWVNPSIVTPGGKWRIIGGPPASFPPYVSWDPSWLGQQNPLTIELPTTMRLRSIGLDLNLTSTVPGGAEGRLLVKLNDHKIADMWLDGGEYLESGTRREYMIHNKIPPLSGHEPSYTLKIWAGGDLRITMKRIFFGDYRFCTLEGSILIDQGEPWAVIEPEIELRSTVPDLTWPNHDFEFYFNHSTDEAQAIECRYSITGIPADIGPFDVLLDVTGYDTAPVQPVQFLPGGSATRDVQITETKFGKRVYNLTRPCTSIPQIVQWNPDLTEDPEFEILIRKSDGHSESYSDFQAVLTNDHWTRELSLAEASPLISNCIYNPADPGSPLPGYRLTAILDDDLPGDGFPEDLYDLEISWKLDGAVCEECTDIQARCLKVANDFNPAMGSLTDGNFDYYFVQVSDVHHFYSQPEHESIFQSVEDWNIVNPSFILSTGDNYEAAGSWAANPVDWNVRIRDLRVPVYMCTGNHDSQTYPRYTYDEQEEDCVYSHGQEIFDLVREGWLKYHSQNTYSFEYDDHIYFCADDNYYYDVEVGGDPGEESCTVVSNEIEWSHVDWLSQQFNAIAAGNLYDAVFTMSHQFGMVCNNCCAGTACEGGAYWYGDQEDHAWGLVDHFGIPQNWQDNIVTMHMAGHAHSLCGIAYEEGSPSKTVSANPVNYRFGPGGSFGGRYGIHYILDDEVRTDYYKDKWSELIDCDCVWDPVEQEHVMTIGDYNLPKTGDLELTFATLMEDPLGRIGILDNGSNWSIPAARVRFEITGAVPGTHTWEKDPANSTTQMFTIVQQYFNDAGTLAIVDCDVYLPNNSSQVKIAVKSVEAP